MLLHNNNVKARINFQFHWQWIQIITSEIAQLRMGAKLTQMFFFWFLSFPIAFMGFH